MELQKKYVEFNKHSSYQCDFQDFSLPINLPRILLEIPRISIIPLGYLRRQTFQLDIVIYQLTNTFAYISSFSKLQILRTTYGFC